MIWESPQGADAGRRSPTASKSSPFRAWPAVSPRRCSLRQGVGIALLAFGAANWPSGATAHPHVFIDCGVDLLFSGDRIDGARLTWTFDDLFSGFLLQEFDRDRNGSLSPAEVHQIEVKHLAEFRRVKFYTAVTLNGQDVTPGPVRDFTAAVWKGLVTYQFTLPLSAPLASTTAIEVVIDDPTYYIAYMATGARPQSQTVGAFVVECRVAHDKSGATPDAVRCGVRRR
jgi:ABC-type uncharacterized transport system substrate-binding protein